MHPCTLSHGSADTAAYCLLSLLSQVLHSAVLDTAYMQDMYCRLAGVLATGIRPHQDGDCHPYAEPFRHAHDHTWLSLTRGRAGAIWVWPGGKCRRAGLQGRMVLPCRGISGQSLPHTYMGNLLEIAASQQSCQTFVDVMAFRLNHRLFSCLRECFCTGSCCLVKAVALFACYLSSSQDVHSAEP